MKNILITGAFGNLGSWILKHLDSKEYNVTVLTKNQRQLNFDFDAEVITCDISNLDDVKNSLGGRSFTHVLHLASVNEGFLDNFPRLALDINTWGTRNLLEVLGDSGLENFIYFSTFQVYGQYEGVIDENTPTVPKHDYGTSHLFAEYYVQQFHKAKNVPFTIFRLTNSYGCPKDLDSSKWYLVLNDLSKSAYENKEIVLRSNGKAPRDFIWMGDVAKVVQQVVDTPATNDIYNITGQRTISMLDVAVEVQKAYKTHFGVDIPIKTNEDDKSEFLTPLDVRSDKLRSLVSFDDAVMFQEEAIEIFKLIEK